MKAKFLSFSIAVVTVLLAAPAWSEAEIETATATAEETAAAAPEEAPTGYVERSSFTTAILEREPQDSITELSSDRTQIFYFTEIRGMAGQTVTHRWKFGGEVIAEVPFEVGGPRWRVYSSKALLPTWLGEWTASAIDSSGRVLSSDAFTYAQAEAAAEPAAAEAAQAETGEAPPAAPAELPSVEAPPAAPADLPLEETPPAAPEG